MQHTRAPLAVKSVLFSVLAVALSGCSVLWGINEDAPPPPVREIRQLIVPTDLNPVLPASSPYTAAIAAAQAVPQPAASQVPAPTTTVAAAAATSVVIEAAKPAVFNRSAKEKNTLFEPYFPTDSEQEAPQQWEMGSSTVFPWVTGAEPSRVNEETVLGAGDRMIGRFFAQVSYEKNIPLPLDKTASVPVTASTEAAPETTTDPAAPPTTEPKPEPVAAPPAQKYVECDGATCLDAARDALVADAKVKGWEMLLNRRVSLHQSFQFRKNNRIVLIEVSSDGKKKLEIEYALLPTQGNASRN